MKEIVNCIDCISNRMVQLEIAGGSVQSKVYLDKPPEGNMYIGPGLVDLQINGFAGVDFNQSPIREADFLKVINALTKEGVTSIFPTIITNADAAIIALLENIDQLCNNNSTISNFVGGIHLEGPFISPQAGARGAHDAQYIKAPDWELFQRFQKASGNRIKITTLSPEWENINAFIKNCVQENIIVAIGHTVANPEQIRSAVEAGATLSTHLGNGAPLSLPRNSNFIFEQLAADQLHASIIADGFHLPDAFLKIALKMKADKAILVSDSTSFAGMEPGIYHSHIGGKVVLQKNRRLATFDNENILAGAAVSLLDCVNKLLTSDLADLSRAWSLASVNPRGLLGEMDGSDLVLFEMMEEGLEVKKVLGNGLGREY